MMRRRDQGPLSPARERLRFGILYVSFFTAAILVLVLWKHDTGGAMAVGVGLWQFDWGVVDLIWLRSGDLERVFLRTRSASLKVASLRAAVGLGLLVYGLFLLV